MTVFTTSQTVCRSCVVRCDTVVYLSGCVASECPSLYANDREGRPQLGCLRGIFTVEIDKAAFEAMQRTPVVGTLGKSLERHARFIELGRDFARDHLQRGVGLVDRGERQRILVHAWQSG